MMRFTTVMTGLAGAPYYSTQYFNGTEQAEANAIAPLLRTFWDSIKGFITAGLTIQISNEVEVINPLTGQIINVLTANQASVVSTGNAPLPKATQGLLRLRSSTFVNGRRVQGRVYIPALANDAQLNGLPHATFVAALTLAANNLRLAVDTANVDWLIWSRPFAGDAESPARDGSEHAVTNVSTWTQFAVLRSRRD